MAVQAQYLAHAFRHDPRAIRYGNDATGASSVFLGDAAAGNDGHLLLTQLQSRGNTVFSDLTCKNNSNDIDGCCFVPRKRARVCGDDDAGACSLMIMEGHMLGGGTLPPQAFTGDVQSREHDSGAASTSGRPAAAAASQGLLSQLHRHGVEIDALVRIENERLRAGLEQARRRHVRGVVSALERAAARRLRAAEDDLARARWCAARSWRRSSGRWWPRPRRGRASPTATRPPPRASAPRSTSSCSCSRRRAPPRARPRPRTRSPAASSNWRRATAGRGRAGRAAGRTRACCCCRAGTCACAPAASPPWTRAPSAPQPRTRRSTSSSTEQ
ncbi:hypothetical protein PR202_ga01550 [Eleusine coracana subsp. coracana]|uniref:Uncharacterized protein n=1 Tax=Eleusine coracana subsp. coracana TaxID=191504 RepID=A0AAV5BF89_ELECO|nr:hypothetical protein PR202_ga00863 [Eleusine coracana subsp. coracana]GJM85754.1 hypothetical protein PR202_ga01550 [Eleusine coracana subsp. coracana]